MIRTPQEFVNEVRARFSERLSDEIEEHGRTVMHFAEENNRLRDLVKRMADKLEVHLGIFTASGVWSETGCHETCSLIREARAAIGEDGP